MTLWVGTPSRTLEIECTSPVEFETTARKKFAALHDALWFLVGRRLLQESVATLIAGGTISFGDEFRLGQQGAWFWHGRLFRSGGEWRLAEWHQLETRVTNGRLEVASHHSSPRSHIATHRTSRFLRRYYESDGAPIATVLHGRSRQQVRADRRKTFLRTIPKELVQ
jgi:hypothetical protein